MTNIFGEFLDDFSERSEFLVLGFSPSSMSIQQRWKNNGLSADFLGDYVKNFFPGDTNAAVNKQTEVRSAVSFIANELLENAMKYSDIKGGIPINLEVHLFSDRLVFASKNSIPPDTIADFQSYIQKLLTADIGEMYVSQIEDKTGNGSGLGYLTMLMDYDAVLGWKFENISPQQSDSSILIPALTENIDPILTTVVTTMVQLPL
jgi:hypothetical protein